MTLYCYISVSMVFHIAQASLLWTVDQKINQYGETLTLLCHVPNCCPRYAGWDSFDAHGIRHTLIIDVKSHVKSTSSKYGGEVRNNGFTLIIRNLLKQDVNVSYACVYGHIIGDHLLLFENEVFKALQVNPQKSGEKNDIFITVIVILLAVVILLSVVIIRIRRAGRAEISSKHCNALEQEEYCESEAFSVIGEKCIKPMETSHTKSTISRNIKERRQSVDSGYNDDVNTE